MSKPLIFRYDISELPDGEPVTAEEIEEMCLARLEERGGNCPETLQQLAALCACEDRLDEAIHYLEDWMALTHDLEQQALIYLKLGALREKVRDFNGAVRFYRIALALEPRGKMAWYFIHNNLGYSLIQLDDPESAIPILRNAADIDPTRANAFKNLGLAYEQLGRFSDAALQFIGATQVNATDGRSVVHLENLVATHPEIAAEVPDISDRIDECRKAVEFAHAQQPDLEQHWTQGRSE